MVDIAARADLATERKRSLTTSTRPERVDSHQVDAPTEGLPSLLGNRALQRLLRRQSIQAQLEVGAADDAYEREADHVAGQLVSDAGADHAVAVERTTPGEAPIARQVRERDGETTDTRAAFTASTALADRLAARRGGGTGLPGATRASFESRLGVDLSGVRIHTDGEAAQLARGINARAFTHGRDVYFSSGAFDPSSRAGRGLLAHELTHVVQQTGGNRGGAGARVSPAGVQRQLIQRRYLDNPYQWRTETQSWSGKAAGLAELLDEYANATEVGAKLRLLDALPNKISQVRVVCTPEALGAFAARQVLAKLTTLEQEIPTEREKLTKQQLTSRTGVSPGRGVGVRPGLGVTTSPPTSGTPTGQSGGLGQQPPRSTPPQSGTGGQVKTTTTTTQPPRQPTPPRQDVRPPIGGTTTTHQQPSSPPQVTPPPTQTGGQGVSPRGLTTVLPERVSPPPETTTTQQPSVVSRLATEIVEILKPLVTAVNNATTPMTRVRELEALLAEYGRQILRAEQTPGAESLVQSLRSQQTTRQEQLTKVSGKIKEEIQNTIEGDVRSAREKTGPERLNAFRALTEKMSRLVTQTQPFPSLRELHDWLIQTRSTVDTIIQRLAKPTPSTPPVRTTPQTDTPPRDPPPQSLPPPTTTQPTGQTGQTTGGQTSGLDVRPGSPPSGTRTDITPPRTPPQTRLPQREQSPTTSPQVVPNPQPTTSLPPPTPSANPTLSRGDQSPVTVIPAKRNVWRGGGETYGPGSTFSSDITVSVEGRDHGVVSFGEFTKFFAKATSGDKYGPLTFQNVAREQLVRSDQVGSDSVWWFTSNLGGYQPDMYVKASDVKVTTTAMSLVKYFGNEYRVATADLETRQAGFKKIEGDKVIFPGSRAPKPEDVHQSNLGDCYLQAVLMSIANQDPNHLKSMIKEAKDTVTVTFFHVTDTTPRAFVKNDIIVEKSLPVGPDGQPLYNSGELWVRFIQKAFAVFAQQHGKYGDAYEPPTKQGYEGIVSGTEFRLYGVFYGDNRKESGRVATTHTARENTLVTDNREIIKLLMQFKGLDPQQTRAGEATLLTASATLQKHLERLKDVLPGLIQIMPTTETQLVGTLNTLKRGLDDAITQERENSEAELSAKPKVSQVINQAKEIAKPDGKLMLYQNDSRVKAALQLLLDLANAGSDSSKGQRFVYSGHAYGVIDVAFANGAGQAMRPQMNKLDEDLTKISPTETKIKMRNPHHSNSPNLTGDTEQEKTDTGEFTLTLAEFIRNFTHVDFGWVKKG